MALFGGPKFQSYLGIDIGVSGIKVVELANEKGRARLVTYGYFPRDPSEANTSFLDQPERTAGIVRKIVEHAKCTTKKTITGIPVANIFSSVLTVNIPSSKKKELDLVVRQQARKIAPRPIEEMVIDYKVIEETPKATKILLTAAEAILVRQYTDIFKKSGVELISLETEPLALVRSLVGRDKSAIIVVDIGAIRTSISVMEKGVPYVSRSIDVGGYFFTRALAEQLGVPIEVAEQMKCDVGAEPSNLPDVQLPKTLQPIVSTITNELRYVMNLYTTQQGWSGAIEKIVLTGGAAVSPRLAETIGNALGIRTYVGDPWARVVYPTDLREVLDKIGPQFAVAIGLAMRDIE